jgi:hypothetical protein
MKIKVNKCVMCGEEPELVKNSYTDEIGKLFFIDPRTKEQLCSKCNAINDSIYNNRGERIKGRAFLINEGSDIPVEISR